MDTSFGQTQWFGKKTAFLGDSITDACHVGTEKNYWQFLQEFLGLEPLVYGINGHRWIHILDQAKKLHDEHGDDVDAIFIFAGTNDYMGSVPLADWYTFAMENVNTNGIMSVKRRRHFQKDTGTFQGCINAAMEYIKETFPRQQIVLMTPIHRAFATFGGTNVQPEESFPNNLGLYVDAYVSAIKEAGNVWACPVIDLNSVSGLYPMTPSHHPFFHLADTDLLHPSAEGHRRIALAMAWQMTAMPASFK